MKFKKNSNYLLVAITCLLLIFSSIGNTSITIKAASINRKAITLTKGKTRKLKVTGTSQKVTWSSSNKKIASVTKKGKVKGVSVGKATITAAIGSQKLTCKVTVTAPSPKSVLNEVHKAVKKAYGNAYYPNSTMDRTALKNIVGLDDALYDAVIAEQPMISVQVDTFIAVHPSNGNKAKVQKVLTNYKTYLEEQTMQYPMNIPKIKASKVLAVGDYVFFIMLGEADDSLTDENKMIEHFKKQNQIAENAIKKLLQ